MLKPSSVFRYRIRNWREYNRALINRGRLTVWFDEDAIAGWRHTAPVVFQFGIYLLLYRTAEFNPVPI